MLDFLDVDLSDQSWMTELFEKGGAPSEEYNFVFTYIWRKTYGMSVTRFHDFVLVFSKTPTPSYLFPCGQGDLKPVLDAVIQDARDRGIQLQLHCLMPEQIEQLEALYPGQFTYELQRDFADYLYAADKLRTLSGKKLHAKRNHINRFLENHPDWRYEPITEENIADCLLMNDLWCKQSNCDENPDLQHEACAVRQAFAHYFELGFDGGILRLGDKIIAYTIGSRMTEDTYMVHFEKAFADIQGAYPMINQQFIQHIDEKYQWINRQDDMGEEGLRKAKLSYYPEKILDKHIAFYKG